MIKQQTLSSVFGGQVWITGGAIFPTGGANAPPVKELKNALITALCVASHGNDVAR